MKSFRNFWFCILLGLATFVSADEPIDYHADIAPLLRDYCAGCHNEVDYDGDFSVETFRALMEGGESEDKVIIDPGHSAKSFLVELLEKEGKGAMPPAKETQPNDEEIALLKRWIDLGAKGPAPEDDESILANLAVPEIAPAAGLEKPITGAAFSPDGKILAVARFGAVDMQDAKTKKVLRSIPDQAGKVNAIHFSPDGKHLVTASGITGLRGVASIFETTTGKLVAEVGGDSHRDILFDAEISPDGTILATAGYDRVIRLWEFPSGKYLRKIDSHNGAVFDLAFSPDSTLLVSASGDQTGKVFSVADGKRLDTLNQPQGEQFAIEVTPNGKFIVGAGADNRIRLWRFVSTEKAKINPVLHARFAHEDAISKLAISKDGKWLVTTSADRALKLWELPAVRQVKAFPEQQDLVSVLTFSPDGKSFLVGRMDGSIQPYSIDDSTLLNRAGGLTELDDDAEVMPRDAGETKMVKEAESDKAQSIGLPAEITGVIGKEGDTDDFRFSAKAGETWIVEVNAAQSKSMLDSKVEVLTAKGEPIERVVLQAVRDSWFTFRGKDSSTSDDFRVHNWMEMELNEYLYANGEVVKLWHYPRGPDSGFKVYPGAGKRKNYFGTSALSHPLGEPCHIVKAFPPGSDPAPNGLPVYRLHYENDDDSERRIGSDSRLAFTAPDDGDYLVRISDVRGFGGEKFNYTLKVRAPQPDFTIKVDGKEAKVSPGSGKELSFEAVREDGFSGAVEIDITGLPEGFTASTPTTIEAGQRIAYVSLNASPDAKAPPEDAFKKIKVTASAKIGGKNTKKDLGDLGKLTVGKAAKVTVKVAPDGEHGKVADDGVLEFEIEPGETISAKVLATRVDFKDRIDFGKDDSGRNLPHGVYVDNIGLNGLMIPVGKDEQTLYMTATDWIPETTRIFHLRTTADGKQGTQPVRIKVVAKKDKS